VSIDETWNVNLEGSRQDETMNSDAEICVSVASWDDGSGAPLTPAMADTTTSLHIDGATSELTDPDWSAGADDSQSCVEINLPKDKPQFGRHYVWFTITTRARATLTTDKDYYGLPFVPVGVFNYSRAKLISVHGQPWYDLISASVGSPLEQLASATHPIRFICVEARPNGTVRKVDSTVVLRHKVMASGAGAPRCTWRVKPPFGVFLEARPVLTPWLRSQLGGTPVRYRGLRFG
jgi:hypothetical protein